MKDPGTSGRLPTAVASEPHVVASPHLAPLDGLRALAIGLVLLYHLTPGHESDLGLRALPFKIADLGWSGVDLFFVLSGFLITGKLIEARSEAEPFRNFYARRALRIFPLYYLALLVALFALPAMSGRFEVPSAADQLPFWLYYSNYRMPDLDFGGLTSLGHFWSLAVEEQFYLLWPVIVLRGSLSRTRQVCVAVFALAPLARLAALMGGAAWQVTFQWTPLRGDGLVVGAMLALLWRHPGWRAALRKWSIPVGLATGAVLAWVAWTHRAGLVFKGQASLETIGARVLLPTLLAVFFGSLLVLALEWRPLARAMSLSPLRPIARYSYGMYVFHFMLIPAFDRWFPAERLAARLGSENRGAVAYFLTGSLLTFALGALSYHLFEARFLALKPQRRPAT